MIPSVCPHMISHFPEKFLIKSKLTLSNVGSVISSISETINRSLPLSTSYFMPTLSQLDLAPIKLRYKVYTISMYYLTTRISTLVFSYLKSCIHRSFLLCPLPSFYSHSILSLPILASFPLMFHLEKPFFAVYHYNKCLTFLAGLLLGEHLSY